MRLTPSTFVCAVPAGLLLLALAAVPAFAGRMDVEVWTDRGNDAVYEPGDAMRVKVRTSADAYLLVYEIDSEGNLNVLFPLRRGTGKIEARRTLRLPDENSDYQLVVEHATGQGFLVAVASDRPFRELPWYLRPFDPQAASIGYEGEPDKADEEGLDDKGRITGDPYVAMERIRRRVMDQASNSYDFATAYTTYYVHEQVRYPRYLCNDCHRPRNWAWWPGFDPYYTHCSVVDFRVNWSWCWGPQMWSSCIPYYYYCVRSDCPPRYRPLYDDRSRFSSWDGQRRWNDLWGGQLRRIKPDPAPVGYVPPPQQGGAWRQGRTPPGFVPPDVRRQGSAPGSGPQTWMQRDRGDGNPVWRQAPRLRPDQGSGRTPPPAVGGNERWRLSWPGLRPDKGDPPQGGQVERTNPWRRSGDRPSNETPRNETPRNDPPRNDPPRYDPPRNDPPRNDPPRNDPPRDQPAPNWRQPPSDSPKWSPPSPKWEPKGHGGNGKG